VSSDCCTLSVGMPGCGGWTSHRCVARAVAVILLDSRAVAVILLDSRAVAVILLD
jgi:hypothetical protein